MDNHQYIEYIFAYEVAPSKREIRQEIFELLLLMMTPSFGSTPGDKKYSQNVHPQPCAQQVVVYSNYISHCLLQFLVRDGLTDDFKSISLMKHLAVRLLKVSLARAGYPVSSITELSNIFKVGHNPKKLMKDYLRELAPSISDYLEVRITWKKS